MLRKGSVVPRQGLLVDFDYSVDLKPERQLEFRDDVFEGSDETLTERADTKEEKSRRNVGPQMDKEYARGQRTVCINNVEILCCLSILYRAHSPSCPLLF